MAMNASDLKNLADKQREADASSNGAPQPTRVERIYKMFTPEDRIRAIKNEPVTVTLGSGTETRDVVIRPINPKLFVEAFQLIREVLLPIANLYGPGKTPGLGDLLGVLGERVDKLPDLFWFIVKRGNEISREWIDDHADLGLDLQLVLPPFIIQNGLERVLGGIDAPSPAAANGASTATAAKAETPQTAESRPSSTSSADTTDGQTTTPGKE